MAKSQPHRPATIFSLSQENSCLAALLSAEYTAGIILPPGVRE